MKRVYFIRPIGMEGPVKIGCGASPDRRRECLQTWQPFPLEIVAEIDGDHTLERRFHALFWDDHRGHEWFDTSAMMKSVIAEIAAGRFDTVCLPAPRALRKPRGLSKGKGHRNPEAAAIIKEMGGTTKLARMLGAPVTTVQHWKTSGIPATHARTIEYLRSHERTVGKAVA